MIEQPKRGMRVAFKPPESAYSTFSRQASVSGQDGILLAWNGCQARVRFESITMNVNQDYLYDLSPSASAASPDALFRDSGGDGTD